MEINDSEHLVKALSLISRRVAQIKSGLLYTESVNISRFL